ncbi:hypothetical protein EP47_08115 [Legionella norrlandica]|uniref:Haloacid dehalogenase n=1 Tax=Legionella norrlandica TaxID=1498499 RepID=A0A0A2SSJ6_9GAMM|nr:hypothetical protein [Legionella norrlandica]KGP64100.1 hypothetical protein EP47_08115 [Legionella norrlandica]
MPLFIIDFDETIASENTHNAVSHITTGGIDSVWAIIKNIPPIGGEEIWQKTIRSIIENGHRLAIASFNAYGSTVIPQYLEEVIGLSSEEIKKIHIESWLPMNPDTSDKNEHIQYVIQEMGYKGSPESIVLIDDDLKNIRSAQAKGYRAILATNNYMQKIQSLSYDWNQPISTSSFFKKVPANNKEDNSTSKNQCLIM